MDPLIFARRLIDTATNFVGLYETESNAAFSDARRSAQLVRAMKQVAWWSPGAAYCAAFDAAIVVLTADALEISSTEFLKHWTAHCQTNARKMQSLRFLSALPTPGSLWLARYGKSESGHAGLVAAVQDKNMATIEGNTSAGPTASSELQRNGDGIYARVRNIAKNGELQTLGFVRPEAILCLLGFSSEGTDTGPAAEIAKPIKPVVRVAEYLESRGYKKLITSAIKQSWSKYDKALGYSVATTEAISNWLADNI